MKDEKDLDIKATVPSFNLVDNATTSWSKDDPLESVSTKPQLDSNPAMFPGGAIPPVNTATFQAQVNDFRVQSEIPPQLILSDEAKLEFLGSLKLQDRFTGNAVTYDGRNLESRYHMIQVSGAIVFNPRSGFTLAASREFSGCLSLGLPALFRSQQALVIFYGCVMGTLPCPVFATAENTTLMTQTLQPRQPFALAALVPAISDIPANGPFGPDCRWVNLKVEPLPQETPFNSDSAIVPYATVLSISVQMLA